MASGVWMTAAEIAALALPGMPGSKRKVNAMAERLGWAQARNARGELLPASEVEALLALLQQLTKDYKHRCDDLDAARAEVEKLRALQTAMIAELLELRGSFPDPKHEHFYTALKEQK